MKNITIILLILLVSIKIGAQPEMLPNMVYLPKSTLDQNYYKKNDKRKWSVSSFYASQYVESNLQYRQYLNFLEKTNNDSLLALAQPDINIWDNIKLNKKEIDYLKNNYWTNGIFDNYPVLGLNYVQIRTYLYWKTNLLNSAYLIYSKNIDTGLVENGYMDLRKMVKDKPEKGKKYIKYPQYNMSILVRLAVLCQYGWRTDNNSSADYKHFMDWLDKNHFYKNLSYRPDINAKFEDSIFQKLEKFDVRPVYVSDIKFLLYNSNTSLPEMTLEYRFLNKKNKKLILYDDIDQLSKMDIEYFKKNNYEFIKRDGNDAYCVKYKIKNGQLKKAIIKKMDDVLFFTFRTYITDRNSNKKTK